MIVCDHCYGVGGSHSSACPRSRRAMVTTTAATPTTTPSLVQFDQADQALDALLTWRAIDIEHGTNGDEGWMALQRLRDAADRIQSLNDQIGDVA